MKILHLIPYNPVQPSFGGALRIYHVLKHLCHNHDVTVAGFSTPEEERELINEFPMLEGKTHFTRPPYSGFSKRWAMVKSLFTSRSYWHQVSKSDRLQHILDQLLREESFDIIQSEFPVLAMYRLNSSALKIIDAHNVEYDNFRRMTRVKNPFKKLFYHIESYKFYREETRVCSEQDALFVTSDRDISVFNESVPGVLKFRIPNGVDMDYFQPCDTLPAPHTLVFVGMMKYVPNYDGINFFLDEIFPRILERYPECTITIIGKNPPASILRRANDNIIVTGFVEDTRPYIKNASVYVVPLRMGGGTRLKIMEALAMKKPLVTTSVGCEGIEVVDRESVLIADDPQAFADAVTELFENEEFARRLTEDGYKLVQDKYGWQNIGRQMDRAYRKLTGPAMSAEDTNGVNKEENKYITDEI